MAVRRTDKQRSAWEDWGRVDPFWAVLTDGERHGGWDIDRFFTTGLEAAGWALAHAEELGRPANRRLALDFGCGVGRVTRALAPHFERTVGLDIAATMVDEARRLDAQRGASGAEFAVYEGDDLADWAGSVDFLISLLVLQHVPSRDVIAGLLRAFVRALSPGGIATVHLPSALPAGSQGYRRLRMRAGDRLRAAGLSARFLYRRGWQPEMLMNAIPYDETVAILEDAGGEVLDATESSVGDGVVNHIYFFARADTGQSP